MKAGWLFKALFTVTLFSTLMPVSGCKPNSAAPASVASCFGTSEHNLSNALGSNTDTSKPSWDKQILWHAGVYDYEGFLTSPVAGKDGRIYIGGFSGKTEENEHDFLAAYLPSGEEAWRLYTGSKPLDRQLAFTKDGALYTLLANGDLLAVTSAGKEKWRKHGVLALAAGLTRPEIIVLTERDELQALKPEDGSPLWSSKQKGMANSAAESLRPSIVISTDGGTILATAKPGALLAFDPEGHKKWTVKLSAAPLSAPAAAMDGTVYVSSASGELMAVSSAGQKLWSFQTAGRSCSAPLIDPSGTVYTGTDKGYVYALSSKGEKQWMFRAQDYSFLSPPVLDRDGSIQITGTGISSDKEIISQKPDRPGRWYALSPDGRLLWSMDLWSFGKASEPVSLDGLTYYVSMTNVRKPIGTLLVIGKALHYGPFSLDEDALLLLERGIQKGIPFPMDYPYDFQMVVDRWGKPDLNIDHEDIQDYIYQKENESIEFTVDEMNAVMYIQIQLEKYDILEVLRRLGLPSSKGTWLKQKQISYMFGEHELKVHNSAGGVRLLLNPFK